MKINLRKITNPVMSGSTLHLWGMKDTRGTEPSKSNKQGSYGLTEHEVANTRPAVSVPGAVHICFINKLVFFGGG